MMSERFLRSAVMAGAMILGIASASPGSNLVVNPAFTGGVLPWTPSPVAALTFDSLDEAGSGSSGSGKVVDNDGGSGSIATISQCVAIDPSVHYRFRADVLFPTGQASGFAEAYAYGYSSNNCSGNSLSSTGIIFSRFVPQRDDWQTIRNENAFVNDSRFHSIRLYLGIDKVPAVAAPMTANFDNVVLEPGEATGPCVPDSVDLCLSDFRFRVRAHWETADAGADAHSLQLTSDSGVYTFFDPGNVEVQLKVLDACPFAHRFWVFASGTTNVGVIVTVTDTKTGTVKIYSNPLGQPFTPILDTDAFATCP